MLDEDCCHNRHRPCFQKCKVEYTISRARLSHHHAQRSAHATQRAASVTALRMLVASLLSVPVVLALAPSPRPLPTAALQVPPSHHLARSRCGACIMAAFDQKLFAQYANPARFQGTELTIVEYPDPVLRAPNEEVAEFDDTLADLCRQMFAVMYQANGVGVAAPQVGINRKIFVYNPDPQAPGALKTMGERVVCNPKIVEYCGATSVEIEGCLSSRSECCRGDICRAKELRVEYQDERGRVKKKKLRGFEARVFQHEYDHLQGVLHLDRQSPRDRARSQPFLDVLVEQHGPGGALDLAPEVAARLTPPVLDSATLPEASAGAARAAGKGTSAETPTATKTAKSTTGFGGAISAKPKKGGPKSKKKR